MKKKKKILHGLQPSFLFTMVGGLGTAHTRLTSTKRLTNLNLDVILIDRGFHILLLMHNSSFGSERLQGTYMNALNPFNSKLMTSIPRGGL